MDYYDLLGVSREASDADIKKAYRKLASKNHPDKGGDTAKFQKIQEAYDTLSNADKKAEYDNKGKGPNINFGQGPGGFRFDFGGQDPEFNDDIADLLRQSFGFGRQGPRGFHQHPRKNKDVRISVSVDLESTLESQDKTILLKLAKGEELVRITIPKGVSSGDTIKFPNLGDTFFENLQRGDLYVSVIVLPHSKFTVNQNNLNMSLFLPVYDAILGTQVEIEGLDKKRFVLTIPAGTQPETKFRVKGEGVTTNHSHSKGDLYIDVRIEIPVNLTDEQKELVKQLKG